MSPKRSGASKKADPSADPIMTTTFRITRTQWGALRQEALDLAIQRGGGRPDASEALRNILEGWMTRKR